MALDIEIDFGNKTSPYWLGLEFTEFNILVDAIKGRDTFPLLHRCLSNYFGDNEIYLDELKGLKSEVIELSEVLKIADDFSMEIFLDSFIKLIEKAIEKRRTIKFIGD